MLRPNTPCRTGWYGRASRAARGAEKKIYSMPEGRGSSQYEDSCLEKLMATKEYRSLWAVLCCELCCFSLGTLGLAISALRSGPQQDDSSKDTRVMWSTQLLTCEVNQNQRTSGGSSMLVRACSKTTTSLCTRK